MASSIPIRLMRCSEERVKSSPSVRMPPSLGGLGVTMWAELASVAYEASTKGPEDLQKQNQLTIGYYQKKYPGSATKRPGKPEPWLNGEADVTDNRAHAFMMRNKANIPACPRVIASQSVACPGCKTVVSAHELAESHVVGCARWSGLGNPTSRHDAAKAELCRQLRLHGHYPVMEAAVGNNLFMDVVVNNDWIDLTVTRFEMQRHKQKVKTYGADSSRAGAKLLVLSFDYSGRPTQAANAAVKRIDSLTGGRAREVLAHVGTVIAQGSGLARLKANGYLHGLMAAGVLARPDKQQTPPDDPGSPDGATSDAPSSDAASTSADVSSRATSVSSDAQSNTSAGELGLACFEAMAATEVSAKGAKSE